MIPQNTIRLEGKKAEQMLNLMEALEDNDDINNVYANFDIPDEVIEAVPLMIVLGVDPGSRVTGIWAGGEKGPIR